MSAGQHMVEDRAGDSVEAEPRSGRATGDHILIPEALSENVHDAATKADFSPAAFVRTAVSTALPVDNTEIDVTGLDTSGDVGYVTLSAPDYRTAKEMVKRSDAESVDAWVRGVVQARVEEVWKAEKARKQAQQFGETALNSLFLPAPDPAGILSVYSGGIIRDPVRVMMNQQGR